MDKETMVTEAVKSLTEEIEKLLFRWFDSIYNTAWKDGYNEGFEPYDKGYDAGYSVGRGVGYDHGVTDGRAATEEE